MWLTGMIEDGEQGGVEDAQQTLPRPGARDDQESDHPQRRADR